MSGIGDGRTVILRLALALETVDTVHVISLVVSTVYEERGWA